MYVRGQDDAGTAGAMGALRGRCLARGGWSVWLLVVCLAAFSCGGEGGVMPDGGDPQAPITCDDQNPCTNDVVEGGACRFDAVEDGRPCDDGDFCTLGDRCRLGQCAAGTRSSGPLARLGTLDTLAGGVIGAIGDRFLAITGPGRSAHLRVAERHGANLVVVASWDGGLDFTFASEVLTQPLDGDLVVLGGRQGRALAIFSVSPPSSPSPASIVKRSDAILDGQLVSLAGHGNRIWACTRDFLRGNEVALVDVSDPDAPSIVGSIVMPADCGSVATSDDGRRVYVNTQEGVRFIDSSPLESGGNPTLSDVFAPTAGVSAGAGYLILRESSAVRIVRQGDHGEVISIPVGGALAASLVGEALLVEGWRTTASGGMEAFAALYDALGASPRARLDEVVLQRVPFQGDTGSSFRNAVIAGTVITAIGQRMFDIAERRFVELRIPALTPLDQLSNVVGGVHAVGYASSAMIDASVPQTPVFTAGGSFGVPLRLETTLEDSVPGPRLFFGFRAEVPSRSGVGRPWEPNPLPVDRWMLDADGRPQLRGSFLLPNSGEGQLLVAGSGLYRMRFARSPGFDVTLQGWPLTALGQAGELAQPTFEVRLAPAPPFQSSGSGSSAFDVDPRARRAVVVIGTSNATSKEGALFWLDLTTTPPTVMEQVQLDARPFEVRVSGSYAVVSTHLELLWFELGKGLLSRHAPTPEPFIKHLLGFDGRTAYYSLLDLSGGPVVGLGASAFGETGPAASQLALDDTAQSMIETDGALVVGLPNQLVTLRPQCQ
jgi:hypothetical protein